MPNVTVTRKSVPSQTSARAGKAGQSNAQNGVGRNRVLSSKTNSGAAGPKPAIPAAKSPQVAQTKAAIRANQLNALRSTLQARLKLKRDQEQTRLATLRQKDRDKEDEKKRKENEAKLGEAISVASHEAVASAGETASAKSSQQKANDNKGGQPAKTASYAGGRGGNGAGKPPTGGGGSSGSSKAANDNVRRQPLFNEHALTSMAKKGREWTKEEISDLVSNPYRTVKTNVRDVRYNKDSGEQNDEPATAYLRNDGHYVVLRDRDGDIVAVSGKNDKDWKWETWHPMYQPTK